MERVDEATPTNKFENNPEDVNVSTNGLKDVAVSATGMPPDSRKYLSSATAPEQPPVTDQVSAAVEEREAEPVKKGLMSRFSSLAGRVPEKHKQRANGEMEHGKQYLRDQFPKERRDQFIYRLKKVVVECQAHPSYQNSLSWFLSQIENYFAHAKNLASSGADSTSSLFSDPMLNQATAEMRTFLERCANGQSMNGMIDAIQKLGQDAKNDEELRDWWGRVATFARKVRLYVSSFYVLQSF